MKVVGLTGGIGSGKTTVSQLFSLIGVPVYIADLRAKNILNLNEEIQSKVQEIFGDASISNGIVNRKFIAKESFNNPEKLKELNSIIHPAVAKDFSVWKEENVQSKYVIKEAAILFESGSNVSCDNVIIVTSPKEVRIERVMQRDNATRQEVEARIENQWPEEKKKALSDFIIANEANSSLIKQVIDIHEKLMNENS